jgi:hypothetical protein
VDIYDNDCHDITEILLKVTLNTITLPDSIKKFTKLHMGFVDLVKKMSVLINFLLQNTNLVSVLGRISPNFDGHV